jgi:hypothetical protein
VKPSPTTLRYKPPIDAIKLGGADRVRTETRYGTLLVWFMRLASVLWVLQGLVHWSAVMLANDDGQGALETMSALGVAAVVFFAVIDLVAAVGLWLAAAWGGVVWLVSVAAQWMVILVLPGFFDYDLLTGTVGLLLVVAYMFLTFAAARETEPYV